MILCFLSAIHSHCQALDLLVWLYFFVAVVYVVVVVVVSCCFLPHLFNLAFPLLSSWLIFFTSYRLSSCYYSFVPVLLDISERICYLLFGIHRGRRNEDMPLLLLAPFLVPLIDGFCEFDCDCRMVSPRFSSVLAILDS